MRIQSDYDPSLQREMIEIHPTILNFFKKRGKVIPLPKKGEKGIIISYSTVKGENAKEIPPDFFSSEEEETHVLEEFPFENNGPINQKNAELVSKNVLRMVLGSGTYPEINRTYMVRGTTRPIKVCFKQKKGEKKGCVYVKKPDVNRIVGWALYDIIRGTTKTKWLFNRSIFVEEGIHGNPLSRLDESLFLGSEKYKEGLIRAAVQAEFLGMGEDVLDYGNRIIDSDLNTVLFDFNILFVPRRSPKNVLLGPYLEIDGFFKDTQLDVYFDEQRRILHRVESHQKNIFELAKVVGQLVDMHGKKIDDRIKDYYWYGARNLEEYVEMRLDEFRKTIKIQQ